MKIPVSHPAFHLPGLAPGNIVKLWRSLELDVNPFNDLSFREAIRVSGRDPGQFLGYFLLVKVSYRDADDAQKDREKGVYYDQQPDGLNLTFFVLDPDTMQMSKRFSPYHFIRRIDQDDP